MLVTTNSTDVWQILGARRLTDIGCHILLQLGDAQLLVIPQGHLPTTVERKHPLGCHWHHHHGKKEAYQS